MDKAQARSRHRNKSKSYEITYIFVDFEKKERQKRIDDAYDYVFGQIEEDENYENGYELTNR